MLSLSSVKTFVKLALTHSIEIIFLKSVNVMKLLPSHSNIRLFLSLREVVRIVAKIETKCLHIKIIIMKIGSQSA